MEDTMDRNAFIAEKFEIKEIIEQNSYNGTVKLDRKNLLLSNLSVC